MNHKNIELTDRLEIHIIELNKLQNEKDIKKIDWLNFIKGDEINMRKNIDKELKEAIEELERITKDPETRELYYQREKDLRDKISEIEEGREEGRTEEKTKLIKSMYENGVELETICKIAKIPKEEVKKY